MKSPPTERKPWQLTAYPGVFLALSLVLLAIALLRTFGVVAGGPVPWYLWVSVLLGGVVSLLGLWGKNWPKNYQRVVEAILILLYGGLLLFRIFRNGVPDTDSHEYLLLIAVAALLLLSPVLAANNRRRLAEEQAQEEARKREQEEKLAELRRSMAPTKQAGEAPAAPDAPECSEDDPSQP